MYIKRLFCIHSTECHDLLKPRNFGDKSLRFDSFYFVVRMVFVDEIVDCVEFSKHFAIFFLLNVSVQAPDFNYRLNFSDFSNKNEEELLNLRQILKIRIFFFFCSRFRRDDTILDENDAFDS